MSTSATSISDRGPVQSPRVAIDVEGLRVSYGAAEVIHGIDLRVDEGSFLAVLGANGAGKTTLLSVLAGLLRPKEGAVHLFGQPAPRASHRRTRAGLAFIGDDRQMFPHLTVAQSMKLVTGRDDARDLFPQLAGIWQRRIGLLSGGEQQMVALGRALSARPRIVVVDELSQGLAPQIRDRLLARLRIAADEGTTVVVVEQAVDAVLRFADTGVVLRQGELVDRRPAAELLADRDGVVDSFLSAAPRIISPSPHHP